MKCDSGCGAEAVVHWYRRPTDAELAQLVAVETARREQIKAESDPELPPPVFPALPSVADTVQAVYACAPHALTLDLAARVHASSCAGPKAAALPQCGCTPEALPAPSEPVPANNPALPAGWQ
jgi:hypothetical protein